MFTSYVNNSTLLKNKKVKKKKRNPEVIGGESDETVMSKQKRSGCESVEENKVVENKVKQEL